MPQYALNSTERYYLEVARAIYADHGGAKGAFLSANGTVCVMGAVQEAVTSNPNDHALLVNTLERFLDSQLEETKSDTRDCACVGCVPSRIVSFNDKPETTKQQVIAVFDKAIAAAYKRK